MSHDRSSRVFSHFCCIDRILGLHLSKRGNFMLDVDSWNAISSDEKSLLATMPCLYRLILVLKNTVAITLNFYH
jgi:hypothetical protein